jgi:Protein of unknown function (DUF732)
MSRRARTRDGRKTRCLQVVGCTAAVTVVALGEYLLGSGHAMCTQLDAGRSPDYVAKHWTYPSASYQNLLDMATAAQNNLCGDN